ncbi:MAG TPA: hypothetical protein VFN65_10220 [Solirubrobacteraceae bacterium]|nr:hypothetical protein [Solirubrobacteraceae bacterium]
MRGHRFVRPALILATREGIERRLLAELDDKPWAAEDGRSWRAAFALEAGGALTRADRLELSVAPDVNVALRSAGVDAEGTIPATARVSEPPAVRLPRADTATPAEPRADTATPAEPPADTPTPAEPRPGPRPRPAQSRATDLERLAARLRAAESELAREHELRESAENTLDTERAQARQTAAELARVRAELALARTAEREAADTAAELDAARRANHELRAHHEALSAEHDRTLRVHAEIEEQLEARTKALAAAQKALDEAQKALAEERGLGRLSGDAGGGHRAAVLHVSHHTPPPRTDRPLNPSLRHRPWLRLLVVIVIAAVLFAVYLVLHSTVLH